MGGEEKEGMEGDVRSIGKGAGIYKSGDGSAGGPWAQQSTGGITTYVLWRT